MKSKSNNLENELLCRYLKSDKKKEMKKHYYLNLYSLNKIRNNYKGCGYVDKSVNSLI